MKKEIARSEYLSRELIPNIEYTINANKILIVGNFTEYINIKRDTFIDNIDVLDFIMSQMWLDKRIKIKMSIEDIKKLYSRYKDHYANYSLLFTDMVSIAHKIEEEGIHYGNSDDSLLNKLTESRNTLLGYNYHSHEYRQFKEIHKRMLDTKQNILNMTENTKELKITL